MKPGRELDALVAEKVMGWKWPDERCPVCGWMFAKSREHGCVPGDCSQRPFPDPIASEAWPHYSTSIADAWQVMEHLGAHGIVKVSNGDGDSFDCDFMPFDSGAFGPYRHASTGGSDSPTESWPHAICLAALQALGETA